MKKIFLFLLLSSCIIGCRYEEGPGISLRSPEYRLLGVWQLLLIEKNGEEITNYDNVANKKGNYYTFFYDGICDVETFYNGNARMSYYGYWAFREKENYLDIEFSLLNVHYAYCAEIKKLSNQDLVYEYTDEMGDEWRLEFSKR